MDDKEAPASSRKVSAALNAIDIDDRLRPAVSALIGAAGGWLRTMDPRAAAVAIFADLSVYYVLYDVPDAEPRRSRAVAEKIQNAIRSAPASAVNAFMAAKGSGAWWPQSAKSRLEKVLGSMPHIGDVLELAPTEAVAVSKSIIDERRKHKLILPPYKDISRTTRELRPSTVIMNGFGLGALLGKLVEIANAIAGMGAGDREVPGALVVLAHDKPIPMVQRGKWTLTLPGGKHWLTFFTTNEKKIEILDHLDRVA